MDADLLALQSWENEGGALEVAPEEEGGNYSQLKPVPPSSIKVERKDPTPVRESKLCFVSGGDQ
jgi:hypothetical protein